MDKKIRWTPKALKSLCSVIAYLKTEWPEKVVIDFEHKLSRKLEILSKYPLSGPQSDIKPGYHKYVITKHNTIFYRIRDNEILILNLYDTRQATKQ